MSGLKKKNESRKIKIKQELEKLKALKAKYKKRLTIARLKTMKGFGHLTDELATHTIQQLEEYAAIVIQQMNRLATQSKNTCLIKK